MGTDDAELFSLFSTDVYKRQALTMVLGIAFFVKVALCFFDYRKHGQFEWTGAAILFVCLIFVLLAPNYIWNIVGI